jgi:hypothetical protein
MSVTGKTVGFTSVVAGWMVGAAASAVAGGIERAGDAMDAALGAGGAVLGGVKSVVSAAEAQVGCPAFDEKSSGMRVHDWVCLLSALQSPMS